MRVSRAGTAIVNVFIEHDAALIARMIGTSSPHCDGVIIKHGDPATVLASTMRGNPLGDGWLIDLDAPGRRIVTWSGNLAEGLFDAHPQTWMGPGTRRLDELCRELAPQLERHGRVLCFQPHSRHVLNDVQSVLNFARRHDSQPFEVSLSPATMLEPGMIPDIEDHLARIIESLGSRCALVHLSDVQLAGEGDEQRCELVALGDGLMPRDLTVSLIQQHVPEHTPVVISAAKIGQQLEWLGRS
jgi:hypothetical protein